MEPVDQRGATEVPLSVEELLAVEGYLGAETACLRMVVTVRLPKSNG